MLPLFFSIFLSVFVANGDAAVLRSDTSARCGPTEIMQLMPCLADVQNQLQVNSTLFQQFTQSFSTGNISDPVPVTDAVCSLLSKFDTCARPVAGNCLFMLEAAALDVYESALELCRSPNVYTYFTQIISCNYKLDLIATASSDDVFSSYIQEIAAAMANASNFNELMALPADTIMNIECRMIERVHEMFPLEKVNETCGADAYETYGALYPQMLEMYKCENETLEHNHTVTNSTTHPNATNTDTTTTPFTTAPVLLLNDTTTAARENSTGTTDRSSSPQAPQPGGGSGYTTYSFPITLFALVVLVH